MNAPAAAALEAEIRARIAQSGPITVAEYMALCLAHPTLGYYVSRDPLGRDGDFITAPEVSQMFGELIGLWAATVWRCIGTPQRVHLVEFGPGRGTLMSDALRAARVVPSFLDAVAVHLIEISAPLAERQREVLADCEVPLAWHRSLDEVPDGPLIVIANEFFDALPVHQAIKCDDGWHERTIHVDANGRLAFGTAAEPWPEIERLPSRALGSPPGTIFEWRDDGAAMALGLRVAHGGGAALIVDYGHTETAVGETLQAVSGHAYVAPLATPGLADLTAHVDFAALKHVLERAGAVVDGPVSQGDFLRRLGIETRASALRAGASTDQARAIDHALNRLAGAGKHDMGRLFKALATSTPGSGPLPGFVT